VREPAPRRFSGCEQRAELPGGAAGLAPKRAGQVRLVSEAGLRCECGEVSLAVGESIKRLAYFEPAAELADRHAAAVVEESTQVVRRQLGDPGQVGEAEPRICGHGLPDLIHYSSGPPSSGEARRDRLRRQACHDGPDQQESSLGQLLGVGARAGLGEEGAVRDIDGRRGEDRSIGSVLGQCRTTGGGIEKSAADCEGRAFVSTDRRAIRCSLPGRST
jgi:hypothetical protein